MLQRIEEPDRELVAQSLAAERGGVDQRGVLGVFEVDDVLGEEVGEIDHAARQRDFVAGQHRLQQRTGQVHVAGGAQRHVGGNVDRQEIAWR